MPWLQLIVNSRFVEAVEACSSDIREQIYRRIKAQDWVLLEMTTERRSLEEVFQQLTLSQGEQEE